MGNLEKAGVLVVVALLAMILVITVMNPPAEVPTVKEGATPSLSIDTPRVVTVDPPVAPPVFVNPAPVVADPTTPRPGMQGLTPVDPMPVVPESRPVAGVEVLRPSPLGSDPMLDRPTPVVETSDFVKVKVGKGDTFAKIAEKRFGKRRVTEGVKAIEAANPGVSSSKLKIGMELDVPKVLPETEKAVSSGGAADEKLGAATDEPAPVKAAAKKAPAKAAPKKEAPKRKPLPFEGG